MTSIISIPDRELAELQDAAARYYRLRLEMSDKYILPHLDSQHGAEYLEQVADDLHEYQYGVAYLGSDGEMRWAQDVIFGSEQMVARMQARKARE